MLICYKLCQSKYIDFWLDNIHCYTVNDTDKSKTIKTDMLNPPVILIGTGIDKVQVSEDVNDAENITKFQKLFVFITHTCPLSILTLFQMTTLESIDMKALPGGLLVIALYNSDKLLTYSVSDKQRNEISVGGLTYSIAILDRNTVVVMLRDFDVVHSIAIVDIRQRQVIQHVDVTLDLPPYSYIPMFYTDDQLYISSHSGITVTDMSGTVDREIDLGFEPTDMCYDTKTARIYCIPNTREKLICIDRDGNTIFTFTDTGLTNPTRLTIP
ncbi:unnamed protein product [Mytilus edulis]|uniref:Uncharacterized protein n=1 Tax=Mytilus edulis TaxID=6550 RepID=A0A8S3U9E8_MYTED|nr:unnamed protein product [Mytilus edulis]